jgi:hypothetical protein
MITFTEDRPIERIEDDLFGRGPIVDMISNAIIQKAKNEHGCYVIGIYGKWGEGKSSVLNMVESKLLDNNDDNILISKFNPWLFKDQESLLLEFFNVLAADSKEKAIADKIKKYAPLVALGVQGMLNIAQLTTRDLLLINSESGVDLRILTEGMVSFSLSHYNELDWNHQTHFTKLHWYDLVEHPGLFAHFDYWQRGIGNNSCFSDCCLPHYETPYPGNYQGAEELTYTLRLIPEPKDR